MIREDKPKLTSKQMIEKMESKNIKFDICSSQEAMTFLEKKNYYFKVNSYRRNFEEINGKYTNLDFAYLIDLAAIDAWLRRFLSPIALNVEHGMKVKILSMIADNHDIDGYEIVNDFRLHDERTTQAYNQTMNYLKENNYATGLYQKHHEDIAVWVLIESMTFGALSQFARFFDTEYSSNGSPFHTLSIQMKSAKRIRNAVSHSNPILINLKNQDSPFPFDEIREKRKKPSVSVIDAAKQMNIKESELLNLKIHDLTSLFYLNKRLTSHRSREHMVEEGKELIKRFDKHQDYYKNINSIQHFKALLTKWVDFQLN